MLIDYLLVVTGILLSLTIATVFVYYRRIRLASKAYEEAKNVVSDIVISFDKQLQQQEEEIATAIQTIETATARNERLSKHLEQQEKSFTTRLNDLSLKVDSKAGSSLDQESLEKDVESLKRQLEGLIEAQRESDQRKAEASESQVETVIPIRKERALAPLTATELHVLEYIATEGEKTAPEIKNFIKLTREHSARLMKKLYEEGYVERRSDKAPYTYRIKEEMLKILKKGEV